MVLETTAPDLTLLLPVTHHALRVLNARLAGTYIVF